MDETRREIKEKNMKSNTYEFCEDKAAWITKIALKQLKKAAEQGETNFQNALGYMYQNGLGGPVNKIEAIKWYMLSAKSDYVTAQFNLAMCYAEGDGVPRDAKTAFRWCLKAAQHGFYPAQYQLGVFYFDGFGVPENKKTARKWLLKSAGQGNQTAQSFLETCFTCSNRKSIYQTPTDNNPSSDTCYPYHCNQGCNKS